MTNFDDLVSDMSTVDVPEILECLVDKYGLSAVVDNLSIVCGNKAQHLRENWQDNSSAKLWDSDAIKLDRLKLEN